MSTEWFDQFAFWYETSWVSIFGAACSAAMLVAFTVFGSLFFYHGARYYQRLNKEAAERKRRIAEKGYPRFVQNNDLKVKYKEDYPDKAGPFAGSYDDPSKPTGEPINEPDWKHVDPIAKANIEAFREELGLSTDGPYSITGRKPSEPEPQWGHKKVSPEEHEAFVNSFVEKEPKEPTVSRHEILDGHGTVLMDIYDEEQDDADAYVEESDIREDAFRKKREAYESLDPSPYLNRSRETYLDPGMPAIDFDEEDNKNG